MLMAIFSIFFDDRPHGIRVTWLSPLHTGTGKFQVRTRGKGLCTIERPEELLQYSTVPRMENGLENDTLGAKTMLSPICSLPTAPCTQRRSECDMTQCAVCVQPSPICCGKCTHAYTRTHESADVNAPGDGGVAD